MTIDDIRIGDRYVWGNSEDTPFTIVDFNRSTIVWYCEGQVINGYNYRDLIRAVNRGNARLLGDRPTIKYKMDRFKFV